MGGMEGTGKQDDTRDGDMALNMTSVMVTWHPL